MNFDDFKKEVASDRRRPKGYTPSRPHPDGLTIPKTITGEWGKVLHCVVRNERD
jgi:hypothetical protein